jgi:hypothetical protein
VLVAEPPGALRDHRADGGLLSRGTGRARRGGRAHWLPVAAGLLVVVWGYLWIVREAHGARVHTVLVAAFALLAFWGVLRALPDRRHVEPRRRSHS